MGHGAATSPLSATPMCTSVRHGPEHSPFAAVDRRRSCVLRHVAPFGLSIILILCIVLTVHSAGALPHRHVPRAWVVGRQLHWGYASPARSSAAPSGHFPPAAPAAERASRGPEHVPRAHEDPLPVRYAAAPGRGPHVATGRRAAALGWGPLTGALAAVSAVGVAGYAWSRGRAAPRARPLRCRALCAAVDGLDWFEKEEVPYFAYGSNVNARVMRGLRGIDAARQDNGVVADHRLGFTLLGYSLVEPSWASCEPSAGDVCHGIVYYLTRQQFATVCSTEGVPVGYSLYPVFVKTYDGRIVEAVTLRTTNGPMRSPFGIDVPPSASYLNVIRQGAREAELDPGWIQYLDALEPNEYALFGGLAERLLRDP